MPFPSFTFTSGRSSGGKGSRSSCQREKENVHSAQEKEMFVKCHLSVTCVYDVAELGWLWTPVQSILFSQLGLARAIQFRHGLRAASVILT